MSNVNLFAFNSIYIMSGLLVLGICLLQYAPIRQYANTPIRSNTFQYASYII